MEGLTFKHPADSLSIYSYGELETVGRQEDRWQHYRLISNLLARSQVLRAASRRHTTG